MNPRRQNQTGTNSHKTVSNLKNYNMEGRLIPSNFWVQCSVCVYTHTDKQKWTYLKTRKIVNINSKHHPLRSFISSQILLSLWDYFTCNEENSK